MAEVLNACCLMHHEEASEVKLFQTVVTRCQWWAGQGMLRALV